MRVWLKQVFLQYLRDRWFLFLFVVVFFCGGVFFGATAARNISIDRADQLAGYLNGFLEKVTTSPISEQLYFRHSVLTNLYIMIAIFILGLTVIGIPLVLVAVFSRGFILGFTVGFLVRVKAVKGFIFALLAVMPHNLLVIPAIILGGVTAISFSLIILKRRLGSPKSPITGQLGAYAAVMACLCLMAASAGFVETYVTPVFIKTVAAWVR